MMIDMTTEIGYRLPDGREVWPIEHGRDGVWTPATDGIPAIDMYDSTTVEDVARVLAGRAVVVTRESVEDRLAAAEAKLAAIRALVNERERAYYAADQRDHVGNRTGPSTDISSYELRRLLS